MNDQAYLQGFIDKCAEHGVDPERLVKVANMKKVIAGKAVKAVQAAKPPMDAVSRQAQAWDRLLQRMSPEERQVFLDRVLMRD
jgi:chemotaxis regulatin CheY-phosphate phosphatase CheZ